MSRGPKPKPTCIRGHVIAVVGRYKSGSCRACHTGCDNPAPYVPGRRGAPIKEFCKNGHALNSDTRYYSRGQFKGCRVCRSKGKKPMFLPVPAAPLMEIVDRIGLKEFCRQAAQTLHVKPQSIERMLARAKAIGFTVSSADQFCVAIGRHPAEVYGSAWFTYGEGEADAC